MISVFDLFKVGIGPSSSHTVGPMRAANLFITGLRDDGHLPRTGTIRAELFGSLGATGHGHGSEKAVLLGLAGEDPETVDIATADQRAAQFKSEGQINGVAVEVVLHRRRSLPEHPNAMTFVASTADGEILCKRTYFSVGGGFVTGETISQPRQQTAAVPYPFTTGAQLLAYDLPISGIMLANELTRRTEAEVHQGLMRIWQVMQECVHNGLRTEGVLPGGLKVKRRAAAFKQQLESELYATDPLRVTDWVTLFALAVNEENAAGGRIVTAPTNGAAGIVPAVLHYYSKFVPSATDEGVVRFLLTAAAIGVLFKENASISGAEVGCQGEVGSACAMAAAGLAEVLGGTPHQVENAAEIAMEHNLGLTCDPVGGLVQIPCIERNAVAAIKAITAARMALRGDGTHHVSLDKVIKTMRETGADMKDKYKETSRGGLAVNVIEC
ncbi:L-serine ammonia-lyase [Catelliglobosispora koreensis]|uniref:L-serine ammonia-lyase n=1 Tax=Catelliglobosispora koreensis TaxID=129052 RepID=UPI00036161B8|nr:L-serine ammonia-lyase [Catelliglobosispora koreensis]